MKRIILIILSTFFVILLGQQSSYSQQPAAKQQTIFKNVESIPAEINPRVTYYQLDGGEFRVNYTNAAGQQTAKNVPMEGTNANPVPRTNLIVDQIDWRNYSAPSFIDEDGNRYSASTINNPTLKYVNFNEHREPSFEGVNYYFDVNQPFVVQLYTRTGHDFVPSETFSQGVNRPGTNFPKMVVRYNVWAEAVWNGRLEETKEIRVIQDTTMRIGDKVQYRAEVRTKPWGSDQWSQWVDVTHRPETEWSTDLRAVASVDGNGMVTGNNVGQANIAARWRTNEYHLVDTAKAIVVDEELVPNPNPNPQPPPPGDCDYIISTPNSGQLLTADTMTPNTSGMIRADNRGSEQFDVTLGIPTSESLYANAFGREYLFQQRFQQMSGQVTYTVPVTKTYELTWQEPKETCDDDGECTTTHEPKSETEYFQENYTVVRPYSYWQIGNLEVYGLQHATMSNYALPNESITLLPNGYTPPNVNADHSNRVEDHVFPANCAPVDMGTQVINGGNERPSVPTENFQSNADAAIGQNQVQNDRVTFNGSTIMNNQRVNQSGPTPSSIPTPGMINQNVLYRSNMVISSSKVNRANTPSSGNIRYNQVIGINGGESEKFFIINGINSVTVHTPVVANGDVSDDEDFNQKTSPNTSRNAVILDRPFTVDLGTHGQHRNIPGYGNRNYEKYVREKQVRIPFDVYNATQTQFIPAGTWINVPGSTSTVEFFTPVWVEEGDYDIEYRVIAENAPSGYSSETYANLNILNHAAIRELPVEVIGRLYDFRVTDVADYNWEEVFRVRQGSPRHTENYYWVGDKEIDGGLRGNSEPFTLPMMVGSHPDSAKANVGIKTGYHFKFDLKTKGNMQGVQDGVRITPSFSFVNKEGTVRENIDLYYHTNDSKFVKIGSDEDTVERFVILNDRLRNISDVDLSNTVSYMYHFYDHLGTSEPFTSFLNAYKRNEMREKTWIGEYDWMILPHRARTFIGPTQVPPGASVTALEAVGAEQQWYGEYSLPAEVYAVPAGTNLASYGRMNTLNEQSSIFLKDGYIIVNFNIESVRNGNTDQPHLQYINAPLSNQWQREGFKYSKTDGLGNTMNLIDGDVIFYHGDLSSIDDFDISGTH
ncbi:MULTISPECIES: DUF5704 domain-containing protein [Alkalihalophilus]|uniref:Ig domain protein group 2 domain protein n=1 Tax=Alkalihalophilus pseudofirmus (strain ATCC BAA-2126 / JCM 17055 / OF4) TaxID=398511 RepID=D3G1K0_ALKPO|nr:MULTISPECIES: DUF5704 domain-containing protein [Alkalihalophilus]ADC52226.1 Ig domain protein group 2 domain protein [Alkalihalophilus pseudofirmus OF4]MEC2074364.1 DUF5704 domain-containing protein [Alkalihalophilus marmarensis]